MSPARLLGIRERIYKFGANLKLAPSTTTRGPCGNNCEIVSNDTGAVYEHMWVETSKKFQIWRHFQIGAKHDHAATGRERIARLPPSRLHQKKKVHGGFDKSYSYRGSRKAPRNLPPLGLEFRAHPGNPGVRCASRQGSK